MSLFWTAPAWTWPLLLVLAAGAVSLSAWSYGRTWPRPRPALRRALIGLRAAVLVLLVLAVAGPVLTRLAADPQPAELLVVVEDSGSMALDAGSKPQAEGGTSRWRRAWTLAAQIDSALAERHPGAATLALRGNGLETVRETAAQQGALADPGAFGTDLEALRRQALESAVDRSVRGLVLLSDGQETRNEPARGIAARGAPLIAVGLGDLEGPADRIIKDLRYPGTVYRDAEMVVELVVDHRFVSGQELPPIEVTLTGPEGVVARRTVPVTDALVPVELSLRPQTSGPQVYRLEVSALDNERFLENNEATLAVDVREERAEVLLLTDRPDWDVRFLALAATREPRLSLTRVYSGPAGLVHADSLVSWTEPATVAEWARWDGVILAGWSGPLAGLDWNRLGEAVRFGLGLLVLAADGGSDPGARPAPPPPGLAELLPIRIVDARWRQAGGAPAPLRSPAEARTHVILDGVPTGGAAGVGWDGLPPLTAWLPVAPIGGGRTLLEIGGRPLPGQPDATDPLVVVAERGQGRSGWYGGWGLWEQAFWNPEGARGKAAVDEGHAARMLARNLLVWVAEGESQRQLAFAGRRLDYQEGEAIGLASTWRDVRGEPVTGRRIELTLRSAGPDSGRGGQGVTERTFELTEIEGRPGEAEVSLPPLPPGAYSVELQGEGDPPVRSRRENLVVTRNSVEATQVRQDGRRLRQLASGPGDAYLDGSRPEALAAILDRLDELDWQPGRDVRRSRFDPLSGWPLLAAAALLLGVEWFLRRRNGLL